MLRGPDPGAVLLRRLRPHFPVRPGERRRRRAYEASRGEQQARRGPGAERERYLVQLMLHRKRKTER